MHCSCWFFWPAVARAGVVSFRPLLVLLVLLAVTLAGGAHAAEPRDTLRVVYSEFPPFEYQAANGEPAGSFIELTRKVAEEAGYDLEFLYVPISRAYFYLKNGNADLWPGLTDIPSLKDDVLESWVSPFAVKLSAWYLLGTEPVEHFDQFQGKTIIVIKGYTYGGLLSYLEQADTITVTEAPNHRAAVDMLKHHRGDYLLDFRQPVLEVLSMPEDRNVRESEVRTRNAAWLFSLARPRATDLREAFDDAYLRLAERNEVPPVRDLSDRFVLPGFPAEYR